MTVQYLHHGCLLHITNVIICIYGQDKSYRGEWSPAAVPLYMHDASRPQILMLYVSGGICLNLNKFVNSYLEKHQTSTDTSCAWLGQTRLGYQPNTRIGVSSTTCVHILLLKWRRTVALAYRMRHRFHPMQIIIILFT